MLCCVWESDCLRGEMDPDAEDARLEQLVALFAAVVEELRGPPWVAAGADSGLSTPQFLGLKFIALHAGCLVRDLAAGLGVSHPAAVKLGDRLVARGLVTKRRSRQDQRASELRLTPRGQAVFAAIWGTQHRTITRIIERMGPGPREQLRAGLCGFLEAALRDEDLIAAVCQHCGIEHDPNCLLNQLHIALTGEPLADSYGVRRR